MWWFILACIVGGGLSGLFGMSRREMDRRAQMRNDALIDAVYDAGGNSDSGDNYSDNSERTSDE